MSQHPQTCLVVDDEGMFLDLLAASLALRGGLQVIAKSVDSLDVGKLFEESAPQICVFGHIPDTGAGLQQALLDLADAYQRAVPDGALILLCGESEAFSDVQIPSGVHAVIDKADSFDTLRKQLDGLLGRPQTRRRQEKFSFRTRKLTNREAEIFALIGDGLTSREIAERLSLSVQTIGAHRKRIASKLGTQRNELSHRAVVSRQAYLVTAGPQA